MVRSGRPKRDGVLALLGSAICVAACFTVPPPPTSLPADAADAKDVADQDAVADAETVSPNDTGADAVMDLPEVDAAPPPPEGFCRAGSSLLAEGQPHPVRACEVCGPKEDWIACPFDCSDSVCSVPVELALGDGFSCLRTTTSAIWCWGERYVPGSNSGSAPDTQESYLPRRLTIDGDPSLKSVVAGRRHACALTDAGELWCWGHNVYNSISSMSPNVVQTPTRAAGDHTFETAAAGYDVTCGIDAGQNVWCWGQTLDGRNEDDWLAGATATNPPTQVPGISATHIAVGHFWACASLATEPVTVACWGHGTSGILGPTSQASPSPVVAEWEGPHGAPTYALRAGAETVFLTVARTETLIEAHGWGDNGLKQLGFGPPPAVVDAPKPLGVTPGNLSGYIAAGQSHACRIDNAGAVACWGDDASCVVNPALHYPSVHTASGYGHSCSIGELGFVECWGSNDRQQLGTPSGQQTWCAPPGIVSAAPFQ